ncbi:sugar ABC transporter substrate-binding protein [Lentibacillus kapialis]|uniref:Maltodextrin-binding protein n=1 Tax=Lentibacillus kapialis TaxID=340214 RepID=A0A917PYA5_9BACI|nr:ABC transporter substrate-binding protein [Lentibacillus kapialis]GGJ99245.1 sugar ABC transporter substrate-binding protein [Lentibacillus kapialis]
MTLWHYWSDHLETELTNRVEAFNASQSDIEVELTYVPYSELTQQLLISGTSGDTPDLIIGGINEIQFYAESGILENITDKVEESGLEDRMYENIAGIHKLDGEFYGVPLHTNAVGLFYNTDMVNEPPTTWDELKQKAADLTKDGQYGFAASAHNSQHGTASWIPFLWSTGSDVSDLQSPEAAKALELWKGMYDEGIMPQEVVNKKLEEVGADFYNGSIAMTIGGSWMIPTFNNEAPDLNWSVAQIPKDQTHSSVIGGESIAIGSGQAVEESWKFIAFMLEPDRQLEWLKATGNFPFGSEVASNPYFQENEVRSVFADIIQSSQGYGWGENHNDINTAIYSAIQDALAGGQSPEEALKKASETIEPLLEEK